MIGAAGWLFGREVAAEASELRRLLPQQMAHVAAWLNTFSWGQAVSDSLQDAVKDAGTLGGLGTVAFTVLGGVLDAVLILFVGVYFARDPICYLEGFLRLLPLRRRGGVRAGARRGRARPWATKWLVAQFAARAIVGVLAGATLAVVGVPLALVLGALAALLEFIPVVGPILFGIPGVLVAFSKGPRLALYALIAYIVVQQLESNLIVPVLQRWAVKMPPVVLLLAVLVAGLLLGPAGIIFAAPLAVVTLSLVNRLYVEDVLEKPRRE